MENMPEMIESEICSRAASIKSTAGKSTGLLREEASSGKSTGLLREEEENGMVVEASFEEAEKNYMLAFQNHTADIRRMQLQYKSECCSKQ